MVHSGLIEGPAFRDLWRRLGRNGRRDVKRVVRGAGRQPQRGPDPRIVASYAFRELQRVPWYLLTIVVATLAAYLVDVLVGKDVAGGVDLGAFAGFFIAIVLFGFYIGRLSDALVDHLALAEARDHAPPT